MALLSVSHLGSEMETKITTSVDSLGEIYSNIASIPVDKNTNKSPESN